MIGGGGAPCWRAAVPWWNATAPDESAAEPLLDGASFDVGDVILAVLASLALGDQSSSGFIAGVPSQPLMMAARSQAMIAPTFARMMVSFRLTRLERVSK